MELKTNRLKILPCTEETVKCAINQNYNNGPEISIHLEQLMIDPSLLNWGSWLVVRKSDNLLIGDIGFKGKPDESKTVEVGYGLLKKYWNNGYATEAMAALMQWAFSTSNVVRIKAETTRDNYGSIRVLEKLNMQKVDHTDTMIFWELKNQ